MLSAEVFSQLRRLRIQARFMINELLHGSFRSAFRGSGLDFKDTREYYPGDDIRRVHWKASARSPHMHIKQFQEERSLRVMMVLDCSSSMASSGKRSLWQRALELAAAITYLAERDGGRLGACLFAETVLEYRPPTARGRRCWDTLLTLLSHQPKGRQSNLRQALEFLSLKLKQRSIVFIISDAYTPQCQDQLKRLALRHEVILVALESFFDGPLTRASIVSMQDSESGEEILLDLSSRRVCRDIEHEAQSRRDELVAICRDCGADCIWVGEDLTLALKTLFASHRARARPLPIGQNQTLAGANSPRVLYQG